MTNKDCAIRAFKEVIQAIEDSAFGMWVYEESEKECGIEIEDWTSGGVDMIHFIDCRRDKNIFNIFDIYSEIREITDNFDVDDEIDCHREDKSYKENFTYSDSVHDFEAWQERLDELKENVNKVVDKYRDKLSDKDFENLGIVAKDYIK